MITMSLWHSCMINFHGEGVLTCAAKVFKSSVGSTDKWRMGFFGLKLESWERISAKICVAGAEI